MGFPMSCVLPYNSATDGTMGFANTSVIIIIVEYDGNSDNAAS